MLGPDGAPAGGGGDATAPGVDAGSNASGGGATSTSVLTYHNDNGRTGQYPAETSLIPSNVNSSRFGMRFVQPVDGYVYAQPLYVPALTINGQAHDVVFVVTESNSVYAFDANASGPVLWHTNVGRRPCLAPDLSTTAEISSRVRGSRANTGHRSGHADDVSRRADQRDSAGSHHRLHAIDLATGAERLGGPVDVSPTAPGTGANSKNGTVAF